jgi:hypothetical protein
VKYALVSTSSNAWHQEFDSLHAALAAHAEELSKGNSYVLVQVIINEDGSEA